MMARRDRGGSLEIKEYVGALAGKGRIVAAVAIVAGFFAVVVFIFQPQKYRATATVSIPQPPTTTTSAIATASQAYADFNGALSSQEVAENAAKAVGVPVSDVAGHLSSSRLEGSSFAEVTYTGTSRDLAPQIVLEASQAALEVVTNARAAPLLQQQTLAQRAYDVATDQYTQFVHDYGITGKDDPLLRQQKNRIVKLQNDLNNARRDGEDTTDLEASLEEIQTKVAQESADLSRVEALQNAALETLQGAQAAYLTEEGILDSVTGGSLVAASDASSAPRLPGLIKAVVPAVVVATGLAIAMIVLLEVVGPVRLPARRRGEPGAPKKPDVRGDRPEETKMPETVDASEPAEVATGTEDGEAVASEAAGAGDEDEDEDEEPERDPAGRIVRSRA
jgi:Chain length determinant protein